jgi:hypothetical protein
MKLKTNFLPFLSRGKHRTIPPPVRVFIFAIIHFMSLYVHLSIGVRWNPILHYDPSYLPCYPMKARVTLEWLCLVNRTTVEVEWLVPLARFRTVILFG